MPYPFHKRGEWAVRNPSFSPLSVPVGIVVWHHTVTPSQATWDPAAMRALENSEIARGGYIALAYHTLFCGDGTQVESRPAGVKGGATYNYNEKSIAIVLPGNYETQEPTIQQYDSMAEWIAGAVGFGLVRPDFLLVGHYQVYPTACQGARNRGREAELRNIVMAKVAAGPATPPPPTTPPPPSPVVTDWEALRELTAAQAIPIVQDGPLLVWKKPPMTGEEVRWWQRSIAVTTKRGLNADGIYGFETFSLTVDWQRWWGLTPDGIVGPQSRAAMVKNLQLV